MVQELEREKKKVILLSPSLAGSVNPLATVWLAFSSGEELVLGRL